MRKKILSLFTLFIVWLFIFPKYSLASSITLSSSQTSILAPDEEFVVNVNLSVSTSNSTVYYLRGEFYQQGTFSYCGFTWNGTGWYNGSYTSNGWVNLL
ncbi:MAG: hypothetical protein NT162_01815, partial [Candidatus Woesebacteria bacterium]|nr:hypothetical protein [Candidatus Woesebacteria bacterium]